MSTDSEPFAAVTPSLGALFLDRVEASGDREAFRYLEGDHWVSATWAETASRVEALAAGLLALGIEPEERVGIASGTRFEWILSDLAIVCAGAATTTVYPNTNVEDTAFIVGDSACRVVFAEDDAQVVKLAERRIDLPALKTVVSFDGFADGEWVITLDDLAEIGAKFLLDHPHCVRDAVTATTPDRLASLIYTSGTTGRPKGVRLSHRAWLQEGAGIAALGVVGADDLQLLWLPLAHAFGKALLAAQLACGFASAVDGRLESIVDNCQAVHPTFMAGVPRLFEKAHNRVVTTARAGGWVRRTLFTKAFASAADLRRRYDAGQEPPRLLRLQAKVFDRLVFAKLRNVFGGRIRFFVSGSAPLNRDIAEWFHDAGMVILEGYGLTETAGGACLNRPGDCRLGTVGQALAGADVRIGDDAEVQVRGPIVMDGYHDSAVATARAFTDDGWLRTGDRGAIDGDGFLTITGRIKDMFKTSGGKYVVPAAIESKFAALCPYASQFLVFGEHRKYCVALVTLDPDALAVWAAEQGLPETPYSQLVASEEINSLIGEYVHQLNDGLNRWETIKKWALLDHDLSVDGGELTPSLKVKRAVIAERYHELIDSLYV